MIRMVNLDRVLRNNLWKHLGPHDADGLTIDYSGEFTAKMYKSEVIARVVETDDGLWEHEHYGVWMLEVNYSPNPPYEWEELQDAQMAIELAEDNLLCIGVPFMPGYVFHGKNRKNKDGRNRGLRRMYDLDAIEENRIDEIEVKMREEEKE